MKRAGTQFGQFMTFLGIAGVLDALEGWKEITSQLRTYLSRSSLGQILNDISLAIFDLYSDLIDIVFFMLPETFRYREYLAMIVLIMLPQLRRFFRKQNDITSIIDESERRFVLYVFIASIVLAYHEKQVGQTGMSLNLYLPLLAPLFFYIPGTLLFRAWATTTRELDHPMFWRIVIFASLVTGWLPLRSGEVISGPRTGDFSLFISMSVLVSFSYLLVYKRRAKLKINEGQEVVDSSLESLLQKVIFFVFMTLWVLFALGLAIFVLLSIYHSLFN